ncbi:hypothetical protein FOZ62_001620 [Perkinsus olseni]|uniref:Uncharacterized protein n=1 Tax=Perkinsus olseni TaxID=32597 RepID=A0A7J6UEP9_PEROL|nr:hypothetical protein FOZ62_001620 [Perkinsus olseni]
MPLRFVVVFFSLAFLADGIGKNEAPLPPPPPPTKKRPDVHYRSFQVDYGDFVHRSKSGPRVTMILNITKDGRGMFEIDCGRSPFRDDWFKLREVDDGPQHGHLQPYKPGDSHHQSWLKSVRGACPNLNVLDEDLDSFYINENRSRRTATQKLCLGMKMLSSSDSGCPAIWEGCSAVDGYQEGYTGWKSFRLWRWRPGKPYRQIPTSYGDTDSFEEDDFMSVRFATPDMMYAFGMFEYDRLYRRPWPQ